jgi:MATE family multidrug resistance protein
MVLIGLFTYVLALPIASAYTVDTAVAQLVATCMPLAAAVMIFDGGQTVAASALRAQNDNWFPTGSHLLAYAVIMPGVGYVLAELQGLGVRGLMLAVFWASVFSVGVLASRLWWLTRARASPP